jgi:hypothetical protein
VSWSLVWHWVSLAFASNVTGKKTLSFQILKVYKSKPPAMRVVFLYHDTRGTGLKSL